ncbi:MAG: saccharopine dehydrogenase C-terminal domain-containing protein, partial [Elusimicrobia bacterium]|nr:saccharopine dehydrogenase C-terminal domain-containing protein [Elusimicrobiota bacterium]
AALNDLADNPKWDRVLAANLSLDRARAVLAKIPQRRKILPIRVDITRTSQARRLLRGSQALLNCVWYEHNLKAMDLALALKAHYVDLGGLFHMTLKQLARDRQFRRAGLRAVLGCGSTPGITNMMAARMAPSFETIDTVAIFDASHDPSLSEDAFLPPFSIRTMLEEYAAPAPVLLGGRMRAVPAHSEPEELDFPEPLGRCSAVTVIHSETATLPGHLKTTGVQNLYFKIVYPEVVRRQLTCLMGMGLNQDAPIAVGGGRISPRQFVTALAHQSATAPADAPADFEVMRVRISGARHRRPLVKTWDCEMRATRHLSAGAMGVGFTGAVAAEMLVLGHAAAPAGVAAPEGMLDSDVFFKELARRKVFVFKETIAHPLLM